MGIICAHLGRGQIVGEKVDDQGLVCRACVAEGALPKGGG